MSRRISIFRDTNELDDWKERRLLPLDTTSNPSTRSLSTGKIISNLNLLSSFLPNEVINFGQNASRKIHNEVCFMSVKICGMIQYSQQCDQLGIYNPDDFLDSLEEYFDPIIETISSHNGDIIKLLPSEIWSIWKYTYHKKSDTVLRNLVHSVINCALRIQRIRDNYEMKEGTLIRVKIGISVGPLGMFKIGDDIISQCVFIGKSLFEVREAANISLPGQILLSLSDKVKLVEYFYITEEFTKFIKILGIGPNWKEKTFSIDAPLIEGQFLVSSTSSEETIFNIVPTRRESEVSKKKILDGNVLLKTLPQPLFKCLLLGKPLNYLSKIQALVAMHISIDISSEYLRDNIDFIDVLLKTLCSIIHDRNGFVYQTKIGSLKLQAVFVFGNEDQNFEISCREALNNALGAFIAFGKLKEVKKISVAVSSGMCYCGVINNSIKRSYILVSPLFKIASKLLKLYPGKIVCDQKAMLHSKLKEDQFILLEYQPMKYYDPGPVFEYVGNNSRSSKIAQEDGLPLLGNEGNIRLMLDAFQKFSSNFKKRRAGKYVDDNEISLVIIEGEKGQGKTKLVNEFSRRVKHKLIIHLDIKPAHKQIPYYTVRKLFEVVLNFHKNMSSKEKHSKLKYLLENLNLSEFLCSLNEVFSTNFDISEEFQMSSDDEKVIIIENLLKRLAYECFEVPYIVIIDVGDNVDKLSCDILFELIEARICFFVLTVTRKPTMDIEVEELIKHKRSIQICLEDMSFSHQTALACQILNVYAVSSALQRFIHKTSEGNPGKIEKILLSMLENYELVLKIVNYSEMKELDLIVPSLRLIQRSANRDKLPVSSENGYIYWKRVTVKCFVLQVHISHATSNKFNVATTSILTYLFIGRETELYHWRYIAIYAYVLQYISVFGVIRRYLRTEIDGISFLDNVQLRRACLTFPINLLDTYYDMKNEEQPEIQNMNKIPVCLLAPNSGLTASISITGSSENVKQSFAGLTYDQKLVVQAASILGDAFPRSMLLYVLNLKHREKNQIDIADAIQGLFELGILCCAKYHNPEMKHLIFKRCFVDISNTCNCLDSSTAEIYDPIPKYAFCQFLKFSSAHYKSVIRKMVPPVAARELHLRALKYLQKETRRCHSCGSGLVDFEKINSNKSLGIVLPLDTSANKCLEDSLKRTFGADDVDKGTGVNLENKCDKYPSFSKYDFSNCECEMILCSVYKQMVEHLRGLEEYTDMLKSLIRSCDICLMLKKYEAVHLLSTYGLKIIQGQIKNLDTSCLHLTEGKFHTLIGQALLGMYRKEEAYASFCTAMNTLGVPLPSGNLGTFLKLITLRIKKNTNFYNCLLSSELTEPNERTETYRTIANCLSGLFKIHKSEKKWRKAELCAIWSLKDNIRKNADLPQILECIINLMKLAYQHKNISFCKSLEQYGLHVCRKNNQFGRRDLTRVLKFYTMCFLLRFHHSKLDIAQHIGNLMINIAININSTGVILSSIPYIVIGLIFRKKISETYSLIRKLEYHSIESKYSKSKIWYFISTLILWLETGHALESFEEYELFYKESSNEVGKHVSEKRKLTILIWLWYVRNEQWQKSFELFREIFEYILSGHFNVEKMSLYALYVFEGILLYLAQRSRDRNILFECNLEDEVIQVCKKFESISVPAIYIPRLMHMKAYHELNKSDEKCNADYLEKALEASYETENILEIGWIEHSKRGWFSNLPDFLKDAWKDNYSKKIDYFTFHQKIIYFTLPVPIN